MVKGKVFVVKIDLISSDGNNSVTTILGEKQLDFIKELADKFNDAVKVLGHAPTMELLTLEVHDECNCF